MANYTSHAIMSELLFNKLNDKNKFKTKINKNNMKLFSFGQDLTVLNLDCFHDTHKMNSKLFFISTIKYIKENNLEYNSNIMAYLYGHIAHYALDVTIHRYIRNLVSGIDKESILTPHTIIECNLDKYLAKKFKTNNKYLSIKPIRDDNLRNLVDNTYQNVYGYFNASNTYFISTLFIKASNYFVNIAYKNKHIYNIVTGRKKYDTNSYFYSCINKDKYLDNKYLKLLNESINKAERIIKYTNKYLYEKDLGLYLDLVFNNAPYNGKETESNESIFNKIPDFIPIKIK